MPGRLIVGQRPLKARMRVQLQPRQPSFAPRKLRMAGQFHSPLAQNQSGSPTNCGRWRVTSTGYHFQPLSVEVCTSVSDTERAGALPAAAAILIYDFRLMTLTFVACSRSSGVDELKIKQQRTNTLREVTSDE